jgi:mannose-6-phosphate isomerase-like protein (cupin superfamily)
MRNLFSAVSFFLCASLAFAENGVVVYSTADLAKMSHELAQKGTPFASKDLERYKDHYTILAHRTATGSSEVHEHEADVFVITSGGAVLVSGGKLLHPQTQKEGEIRGTGIEGGEKRAVAAGDIVHIAAGVPHQLLIEKGKPVTYFVVKVTGQ